MAPFFPSGYFPHPLCFCFWNSVVSLLLFSLPWIFFFCLLFHLHSPQNTPISELVPAPMTLDLPEQEFGMYSNLKAGSLWAENVSDLTSGLGAAPSSPESVLTADGSDFGTSLFASPTFPVRGDLGSPLSHAPASPTFSTVSALSTASPVPTTPVTSLYSSSPTPASAPAPVSVAPAPVATAEDLFKTGVTPSTKKAGATPAEAALAVRKPVTPKAGTKEKARKRKRFPQDPEAQAAAAAAAAAWANGSTAWKNHQAFARPRNGIPCKGYNQQKKAPCGNCALKEFIGTQPLYCAEHISLDPEGAYKKCAVREPCASGNGTKVCKEVVLKEFGICYKHIHLRLETMLETEEGKETMRQWLVRIREIVLQLNAEARANKKVATDLYERKLKLIPKYTKMRKTIDSVLQGVPPLEAVAMAASSTANKASLIPEGADEETIAKAMQK